MADPLRALIVEDSEDDLFLLVRHLHQGGFELTHRWVDSYEAMRRALADSSWDLILCDYILPQFGVSGALALKAEYQIDIPFIVISGTIGEEKTAELLQQGVHDFILKDNLARLIPAIERELSQAELRRQHRQAQEALHESEKRYRHLVENQGELVCCFLPDTTLTFVNQAYADYHGTAREALLGSQWLATLPAEEQPEAKAWLPAFTPEQSTSRYERPLICPKRDKRWLIWNTRAFFEGEKLTHFQSVGTDITERKQAEKTIQYMAYHDALTGLPNRALLEDRLQHSLTQARRFDTQVGILVIDFDRFKAINDALGHSVGDKYLEAIAQRLIPTIRECDTLARIGGDEFVVLLENLTQTVAAWKVGERIHQALQTPIPIDGQELIASCSIGISIYPEDSTNADTLLQHADIAMYAAKSKGGGQSRSYSASLGHQALQQLDLEQGLRRLWEHNQLRLYYQVQVNLSTGQLRGLEALVRWQHPKWGLISPGQFIPLAEQTGLISSLGEWVLKTACHQARAWQSAGYSPVPISVNLSARQIDRRLIEVVEDTLRETRLDPHYLELELTETAAMQNFDRTIEILGALRELGVQIMLDDFGKGYSSLNCLWHLPLDGIKLDMAFTQSLSDNEQFAPMTSAVLHIVHSLGKRALAEGVETEAQASLLHSQGCNDAQGFLFGYPIPTEEMTRLFARRSGQGELYTAPRKGNSIKAL